MRVGLVLSPFALFGGAVRLGGDGGFAAAVAVVNVHEAEGVEPPAPTAVTDHANWVPLARVAGVYKLPVTVATCAPLRITM